LDSHLNFEYSFRVERGTLPMMLKIEIVALALVAGVLVFAATRQSTLHVQRSILVNAPPETIFALVDDFHNWPMWAPQDREDVTMTRTYSGAVSGDGAVSEWQSKGSAGQGKMSIIESTKPTRIVVHVDFVKPFTAHNINEFTLAPSGAATKVTWSMQGTNLFMMKLMGVFVNMDKVAGRHFESGLMSLKVIAEK
jgi:uncharacterized protein YndB with AHSA1/START domain